MTRILNKVIGGNRMKQEELRENIERLHNYYGVAYKTIATAADISQGYMSKWIHREREVSYKTYKKIEKFYNDFMERRV